VQQVRDAPAGQPGQDAGHFGAGHEKVTLTKVDPQLVVDLSADATASRAPTACKRLNELINRGPSLQLRPNRDPAGS